MIDSRNFPDSPFVDGKFMAAPNAPHRTLIDPATGEVCGEMAEAVSEDAAMAVASAERAFQQHWRKLPPGKRAEHLLAIAAQIDAMVETIAWADCWSMGKPISAARSEARYGSAAFRHYAGALAHWSGETLPIGRGGFDFTLRVPFGVVAGILPWNFPFPIACWKTAAALAAGNCMILKPAETTPWSALLLGQATVNAGLPDGVLQVLPGEGSIVGEALVSDSKVRKISFTGSTASGRRILAIGAAEVKRISLELGGKSPNMVFSDCDLEKVIHSSPMAVFDNTGQDCCARSRILVEESVADTFIEGFLAATAKIKVGDPKKEDTQLGPLAHRKQYDVVRNHVDAACKAGRKFLCGGEAFDGEKGFFFAPTLIVDCETGDPWWREEIFGPVACLRRFSTEKQAVDEANDSPYGLSGSLWTQDIARVLRLCRGIETGVLSVNSHSSVHLEAPFGGVKQSGLGRELGAAGLEAFTEIKNIYIGES